MSLSNPTPVKTYRLGVIAAKDVDNPGIMEELLGENLSAVGHLHTNGANRGIISFAIQNGISSSVWPINGGRTLPWSTSRIVENSDFVFIIATPDSKSAGLAAKECETKGVKHRVVHYEPCTHWRTKVEQITEIMAAQSDADIEANPVLRSIRGVL